MEGKEHYFMIGALILIVVASVISISYSQWTGNAIFNRQPSVQLREFQNQEVSTASLQISLGKGVCDAFIAENGDTKYIIKAGGIPFTLYNVKPGDFNSYRIMPTGMLKDGRACQDVFKPVTKTVRVRRGVNSLSLNGFN